MKKILMALCGVAIMLSSCDATSNKKVSQNEAVGDSIAVTLGKLVGYQNQQQFDRMLQQMSENEREKISKAEFFRGLAQVLNNDSTNMAYLYGLSTGLQLYGQIYMGPGEAGVTVNPKTFLRNFKEAFMADTVDVEMMQLQMEMQALNMRMQQLAQEKRENEIKSSPEYIANEKAAKKAATEYAAKGFETAESGLIYKIEEPGKGDLVKRSDRVLVKYTGKHLNGEVFDQSPETGTKFGVTGVVPGFSEGLQMLAKGGKATLVIPGELAYGNNGAPGAGITPNETLVFDVEILDINPEN